MALAFGFVRAIDAITEAVGRFVAWLILIAVLVSAVNALARKFLSVSSNAWLELQWYLFGAAFMLGAAWVLKQNAHVRIDVLSTRLTKRTRDWIDLFGHTFMLLPLTVLMVYLTVPYVITSFLDQEMSYNAGGLLLWPAQAMILAGFALLLLQAVAEIVRRALILSGSLEDNAQADPHTPLAEAAVASRGQKND